MKTLFIGGTGIISTACSDLCIEKGFDLFLLNRGKSLKSGLSDYTHITADIYNETQVNELLKEHHFDVVVDWISYTLEDVQRAFRLFHKKTSQYIFISSASAYKKPPPIPITESHPLDNPYWAYSQNKIKCEKFLNEAATLHNFPVTIVRPSHTYDKTKIALPGGYNALNRLLQQKPVIIHGDGNTLWTLTHSRDFATGFIGLLGNEKAIGETYHITGDEYLTWNQICFTLADACGVEPKIIHIPSDFIKHFDKELGNSLVGDKAHNMVFDNSKIKKLNPYFKAQIPFAAGAREIIDWYGAEKARQVVDPSIENIMENIISANKKSLSE